MDEVVVGRGVEAVVGMLVVVGVLEVVGVFEVVDVVGAVVGGVQVLVGDCVLDVGGRDVDVVEETPLP